MENVEDIVIVGAGVAGLATALGLHRLGIRSLVLESWNGLRQTGSAITACTNSWKAFDVLGIGDELRQNHLQLEGIASYSAVSGLPTSEMSFKVKAKHGEHEIRCLTRKLLLESLAKELPQGTVRFSAKVVAIEEAKYFKMVHLADGSILKTKVLIGCDGVNSMVAKSLGHRPPSFTQRVEIRGLAEFPDGHGIQPKFLQYSGDGFCAGFIPCNQKTIYWFFSHSKSIQKKGEGEDKDPSKLKEFVLQNLGKVPKEIVGIVEQTSLDCIISSTLRFRPPLDILWKGGICKENVCVIGDALHAMTPDLSQGGCAALEDGIVMAKYIAEAFQPNEKNEKVYDDEEKYKRIEKALKNFEEERKWRSFQLVTTAYMLGATLQRTGRIGNLWIGKVLLRYLSGLYLKIADYDCGKLTKKQ